MNTSKKNILYTISTCVLLLILTNLGIRIIKDFPERPYLGLTAIILSFLTLYFSSYILDIRNSQSKLDEIEKEIEIIKKEREFDEKLLNKIKDIVLLGKIRGKNK
jgi:hypothetical protein